MQPDSLIKSTLDKASCQNWAVEFTPDTYLKYLKEDHDHKDLVYLTADSPNTIEVLDEKKAYIIGGIVDRNRHINLTFNKAEEQGISHGKLPINEHLKLTTSAVLTVNHVFEIVAEQFNIKDWGKTLNKVIPERKIMNDKNQ